MKYVSIEIVKDGKFSELLREDPFAAAMYILLVSYSGGEVFLKTQSLRNLFKEVSMATIVSSLNKLERLGFIESKFIMADPAGSSPAWSIVNHPWLLPLACTHTPTRDSTGTSSSSKCSNNIYINNKYNTTDTDTSISINVLPGTDTSSTTSNTNFSTNAPPRSARDAGAHEEDSSQNTIEEVMEILHKWWNDDTYKDKRKLIEKTVLNPDFAGLDHSFVATEYSQWLDRNPPKGKTKTRNIGTGYRNWCENKVYGFGKKTKPKPTPKLKISPSIAPWHDVLSTLRDSLTRSGPDESDLTIFEQEVLSLKAGLEGGGILRLQCLNEEHKNAVEKFWDGKIRSALKYRGHELRPIYVLEGDT